MTDEQIFLAAIDLDDPTERQTFVEEACDGDFELRRQVEELLGAHFRTGDFLDKPAVKQLAGGSTTIIPGLNEPSSAVAADYYQFLQPPTRPDAIGRCFHNWPDVSQC